ncbi:unnamed protein product [Euphydryas editha]|uniref:Uncharacterized protein n=1 Tax=Euphydryas editha TaxID=104508 RepID=A0AAU9TZM1_EUPED|nr:unnamed protein product [Euphydryas editha]
MALGGSTFLQNATMLEQLLEEINFQRTKEMRQLMKDVKRRKSRGHESMRGTSKSFTCGIMASGVDEILQYLGQLCPVGSSTIQELQSKGNYKSYKNGVPVDFCTKCFSTDVWPVNARIKT